MTQNPDHSPADTPYSFRDSRFTLKSKSPLQMRFSCSLTLAMMFWFISIMFLGYLLYEIPDLFTSIFGWFMLLLVFFFCGYPAMRITYYLVQCILSFSNPRPYLEMAPSKIQPGGEANLEWVMTGAADRIRRLRIWLENREEIVRQSHPQPSKLLVKIPIYETENTPEIRRGHIQFALPETAEPSFFDDKKNRSWFVCVRGEIDRWPDIDEEYEITVIPS